MCLALPVLVTMMVSLQTAPGGPPQIGNSKQFFIDDFVIDSLHDLTKIVHHPERYHENPVLTGTEPWERWLLGGRTAIAKAYSKDGIHWQLNGDGKPWFRAEHNSNLLGWVPRIGRYVIYPRVPGPPSTDGQAASAAIGRSTSTDFVTWSEPQTVLAATPADRDKDFKGLAAFAHGDVYLGFLWVFHRNQTADAELAFSRDCLRWQRVSPGEFFFGRGLPGSWDSEMILPVAPVVFADKIWIYYSGWNLPYTEQAMERAQAGWVEDGRRMQRAIGLATVRVDGFVSLDAGEQTGTLTTRALEVPGSRFMVNAAVRGELRVEILDEHGKALPGYSSVDCLPIRTDAVEQTVRWQGKPNLVGLRGKSIKLRFLLRDGSLYAFCFAD